MSEAVIRFLNQQIAKNNNITQINLEYRMLSDLLPIMHLLTQFPHLKKLNLHGNRLRELPTDLSSLKPIEELDISNNLLENNFEMTVLSLQSLPRLRKLVYQVTTKEQELLKHLPNLQVLNGKQVSTDHAQQPQESQENSIQGAEETVNQYLTQTVDLYQQFLRFSSQSISESTVAQKSSQFRHDLEQHVLKISNNDEWLFKYQISCILRDQILDHYWESFGDSGELLQKLFKHQDQLCLTSKASTHPRMVDESISFLEDPKLMETAKGSPNISVLQREIKRSRDRTKDLEDQLADMSAENHRLMEMLTKFAKGNKAILPLPRIGKHIEKDKSAAVSRYQSIRDEKTNSVMMYESIGGKPLTLKQLKDTIDQIYQSKLKYDQRNQEGKIPRETMQQYLYTHLNQKYGLKALTLENTNSIMSGIEIYSAEDNDVAAFGKILRNQLDEEFRFVQVELKNTVTHLLRMHIQSRHPYKSVSEVNELLMEKHSGYVTREECEDIIRYLYNEQDSKLIIDSLEDLIRTEKRDDHRQGLYRRRTKEELTKDKPKIRFDSFIYALLEFQMQLHQKFLKPLVTIFKRRDTNSDGILNEEQFIELIEELCEEAQDLLPTFLEIVDPQETKQVTFTQIVRLLANYPEDNPVLSRYQNVGEKVDAQ